MAIGTQTITPHLTDYTSFTAAVYWYIFKELYPDLSGVVPAYAGIIMR